ncbi:hypothetical protein BC833DRAFT_353444 [Globomyces pollinis-pini]|nr:hypothetical protein BC833DRAFT_353444 [Globomyces pollinis-pini]
MPNIPTKPHSLYNKKLTLFTNICSQSWRLFYYYIKPFIKHTSEQKLDHLSEILIWAHDQLGRVGLCGGEDGAFLRLILSHVSEKDLQYSHELYQCCKCLFDTNMIANPNQILIDHKCKSANFGTEAATILFNSLRPQLIGRLDGQSIRSIPKEMKDTLDKIAILFKNPPLEHVYVKRNSKAIELLLHSDIDITLVNPNRPQHLAVYEVPAVCQDISSVCFDLYSLQGKLLLNSYYSAKQDQQSLAALKSAVEKFKFHLFVKPFDIDAWVSLGNCFLMLSYEKLGSKIAEYVDRQDISSYQKKAFHCFVRASKLEMKQRNSLSVDYQFELTNTLWGNFGLLCLSILSAPMNGIALTGSSSTVLETWNKKSKSLQENSIEASTNTDLETEKLSLEKSKKYLYGIAAFLFKRAYEKNSFSWIFMLRLAHIYRKLDRPPKV